MKKPTEQERNDLEAYLDDLTRMLKEYEAGLAEVEKPDYDPHCDEEDVEACRRNDIAYYEEEIGDTRREMRRVRRKLGMKEEA